MKMITDVIGFLIEKNESRNVFVGFEWESVAYVGNDKQEREKITEGVVTQHLWMPMVIRRDKSWGARQRRGI